MTAAIVPTLIRGRKLRRIGLNVKNARLSMRLFFWASLLILPSVLLVIWLFRLCGINSPLQQGGGLQNRWCYWIVFQFLYIAMAEELFFRGYLQTNILAITKKLMRRGLFQRFVVVFASAICFAAAHMIIRFQIAGILTFFPGLVLGWLFLRTRSLLAPVLFHGLANTCFVLICMFLT